MPNVNHRLKWVAQAQVQGQVNAKSQTIVSIRGVTSFILYSCTDSRRDVSSSNVGFMHEGEEHALSFFMQHCFFLTLAHFVKKTFAFSNRGFLHDALA